MPRLTRYVSPALLRTAHSIASFALALLLGACGVENTAMVRETDEAMTRIEARLAVGGDSTALCVEYIGLCEQGLGLCLEGNNASTYQTFCSGLQARCNTTVEAHCRAPQPDGGPGTQPRVDAGAPQADAGSTRPPDAGTASGPVISAVAALNLTQTTASISWTLNEAATGQVEYGTTAAYGRTSVKETSFRYSAHLQALSGLAPGTRYHYRVRSANQSGFESVSGDFTFTTAGTTTPLPTGGAHAPLPTSPLVVSVRDTGARCDGVTDDTVAIQKAVDRVGGTGGTVLVPAGTCMVNAVGNQGAAGNARYAILLRSNMTFKMEPGAVLKARPNNAWAYNVLFAAKVANVNIVGGTVEGERHEHLTPGDNALTTPTHPTLCPNSGNCYGQWGYCVSIYQSADVFVDGVVSRECWGDGYTIWGEGSGSSNITLSNVVATDNRRQGLSVVAGNGIVVQNSVFENTAGHWPMAGIDIEPDSPMTVNRMTIRNSRFVNNYTGVVLARSYSGSTNNVAVTGNTFIDNKYVGIRVCSNGTGFSFENNTITGSPAHPAAQVGANEIDFKCIYVP